MSSSVTELSATSQLLTEEDLVTSNSTQDTKSGALSGIQSAEQISTTLDAASAPQIVLLVWMTLVFLALRTHITETLPIAPLLFAHQNSLSLDLFATQSALTRLTVLAQSAGEDAQLEPPSAVLCA